jgi:excinuclease ABC subunit A
LFFENIPNIIQKIRTLHEVGLSYITLGQQSTTLSGGEAQRVKLATELSKRDTGKTFYILDEPSTGLHFEDIRILLEVLNKLVEHGNTVLVIEHNMDIIKLADHIIDMGPEGGKGGGTVICEGTPEQIIKNKQSFTAQYLKKEITPKFQNANVVNE